MFRPGLITNGATLLVTTSPQAILPAFLAGVFLNNIIKSYNIRVLLYTRVVYTYGTFT